MNRIRLILLILLTLSIPVLTVQSSDPLVTLSYINTTFVPELLTTGSAMIDAEIDAFLTGTDPETGVGVQSDRSGITRYSLKEGGTAVIDSLTGFTLSSGVVALRVESGEVIDLTAGAVTNEYLQAGLNRRYFVAENSKAELLVYSADAELIIDGSATVTITGVIPGHRRFIDVPPSHWANTYITSAYNSGITTGIDEYLFGPSDSMTRAMFVTMLGRLDPEEKPRVDSGFDDVDDDDWYGRYVAWASANAITLGVGGALFSPTVSITREQMATFLYRYATLIGLVDSEQTTEADLTDTPADTPTDAPTDAPTDTPTFPDLNTASEYAVDAIIWAASKGIITGDDGMFAPNRTATRAEVCAILTRLQDIM